jgi:transketolase
MPMGNIARKWEAFGWYVQEIDGHDFEQIFNAIDNAKRNEGKPSMIIQYTIKGKGVSFMENVVAWHGKTPNHEDYLNAMKELS